MGRVAKPVVALMYGAAGAGGLTRGIRPAYSSEGTSPQGTFGVLQLVVEMAMGEASRVTLEGMPVPHGTSNSPLE